MSPAGLQCLGSNTPFAQSLAPGHTCSQGHSPSSVAGTDLLTLKYTYRACWESAGHPIAKRHRLILRDTTPHPHVHFIDSLAILAGSSPVITHTHIHTSHWRCRHTGTPTCSLTPAVALDPPHICMHIE